MEKHTVFWRNNLYSFHQGVCQWLTTAKKINSNKQTNQQTNKTDNLEISQNKEEIILWHFKEIGFILGSEERVNVLFFKLTTNIERDLKSVLIAQWKIMHI